MAKKGQRKQPPVPPGKAKKIKNSENPGLPARKRKKH